MVEIDIDEAKRFLKEKEDRARQKQWEERDRIINDLKGLTKIWQKYNIKRVYLYGSLTDGKRHSESDIDIAVEGDISYQDLLRLYGEVDRGITGVSRELDLRNLGELSFKEAVREKGIVIYEK